MGQRKSSVGKATGVTPIKASIAAGARAPIEEQVMTETTTGNAANAAFADFSTKTKSAVEKGTKIVEDFSDLTKGNIEALVAAARAASKNAETLGQTAAEYSRRSFEDTTRALKTLSAVKTPADFFKIQQDLAKAHFDSLAAEGAKFTELAVKMVGDVVEPLSTRASVAAEKVKASFV